MSRTVDQEKRVNPSPATLIWATVLLGGAPAAATAQSPYRKSYVDLDVGIAVEEAQVNVRSALGLAGAAAIGRQLTPRLAVEARLGGQVFLAPEQFTSPGGCLGVVPCVTRTPGPLQVVTLGANAIYSATTQGVAPLLLAGVGVRNIAQAPEHSSETRPFGEIGAGIAVPVGLARWHIDARIQLAPASSDVPRSTIVVTTGVRF